MRSYWIWLLALALAWTFALLHEHTVAAAVMPWRLLYCAAFFALFFLAPLFRQKQRRLTAILCLAAIFAILALWPDKVSILILIPCSFLPSWLEKQSIVFLSDML